MVRIVSLVVVFLAIASLAIAQTTQKGDFVASVGSEGWTLASGTGERTHIEFVQFDKPFDSPPNVLISIAGYDASVGKDQSLKLHCTVDKVSKVGCVVKIKTWGDCKVGAVWGSWLAVAK